MNVGRGARVIAKAFPARLLLRSHDAAKEIGNYSNEIIHQYLELARQRLLPWPFHPIGYALANTQSMDYMWMPFLIAWALKRLVLRYGGMRLYRRSLPFFLGLILGDYAVPALWFAYGWIQGIQMYLSFPH